MLVKSIPQVCVDSYCANQKAGKAFLKFAFTPLFLPNTKSKNAKVAMSATVDAIKASPLNPGAWKA